MILSPGRGSSRGIHLDRRGTQAAPRFAFGGKLATSDIAIKSGLEHAEAILTADAFERPWSHDGASPGGRPIPLTDLGNSERFVYAFGGDLRFCHDTRKWLFWDGKRWAEDRTGEVVRCAKRTVRNVLFEIAAMDVESHVKELTAHQIRSESDRSLKAMIGLAASDATIAARIEQFDQDPFLFNVQNGTLDLRTGALLPHSREHRITKISPVTFDPEAKCPRWEAFLARVLPDRELREYVQDAAGYSLTGDTTEEAVFLQYGTGKNGKSRFNEAVRYVAGDHAASCEIKSFLVKKNDGGANNDIARLRGARFVTASESEAGKRLAEALLKELTGNDMITARYLYGEYFDFRPTLKLWLSTNHRPKVGGTDEGIWRRIKLIPYTVTIPEEERDKHLGDKLKAEASGILNWCVAGGVRWTIRGLVEPSSVRSSTAEYRDEQDGIAHFIDEKLTRESNAEVRASELIEAYANHCAENGESRLPSRALSDGLIERGFTKRRVGARSSKPAGFYWSGICVRV